MSNIISFHLEDAGGLSYIEASKIKRSPHSYKPSCKSRYGFFKVRIAIFISKIISFHLEDVGG